MGVILKKRKIKRLNCKQIDTNSKYDINFYNIVSLYRTTNNTVDPLIPLDTRYLTKFFQLHVHVDLLKILQMYPHLRHTPISLLYHTDTHADTFTNKQNV